MSGNPEAPGLGPSAEDLSAAIREVVELLAAKRNGGQAELSRALGSADNRINRFVSGKRDLTIDELSKVVDELGRDPAIFVEMVRLQLPVPGPAAVMRFLGLPNGQTDEPFLLELEQMIGTARSDSAFDPGPRKEELKELDDLRFAGAAVAQERAEIMIREMAAGLGGPVDERVRHELALAIGLWAAIARATGRKEASASAYAFAFELIAEPKDCEAEAILRSRASYLLIDLGFPSFAVSFLNPAAEYFLISLKHAQFGTCLVDRAVALIIKGDADQAEVALRTALNLLPREEWRYRAAAFHSLAACAEKRQNWPQARQLLDSAVREYGTRRDSICGQFYWAIGRHAVTDGRFNEASTAFRKAAEILSDLGEPFEGELALLDVAEVAAKRQKLTELQQLGHEFLAKLPRNSHSRSAKDILIKLSNVLLFGSLKEIHAAIESSRERLKELGKLYLLPSFTHR